MAKVLIVDDDKELVDKITTWLSMEGYLVESVGLGLDALQLLENTAYDVIVLDWSLPDTTGVDVCKTYRRNGGKSPVIFLTGHGHISDKEAGLDSGADDYLVKPFEARELNARLRSLLRRPFGLSMNALQAAGLTLEIDSRTVSDGKTTLRLTPRETALFEYMLRHPNRNYSANTLLNYVWPQESEASEDTVRTIMKTLRQKLAKLDQPNLIKTIKGSGYIFEQ